MANPTKPHSRRRFNPTLAPSSALASVVVLLLVFAMTGRTAASWSRLAEPWPDREAVRGIAGTPVSWPSKSPFAPQDIGAGAEAEPPTTAIGRFYLPPGFHARHSVPAVVLLHGSGGVLSTRELTYAAQLAEMGVAALVVD